MWSFSEQGDLMNGKEFRNGYTDSASPGMTSVWWKSPGSYLSLPASLDATGQSILQGFQWEDADHIIYASFFFAVTSWMLVSRLARLLAWEQPRTKPDCSLTPDGTPSSDFRAGWNFLPQDIQERVIAGLPYENVHQLKVVSKQMRECIERDSFLSLHNALNSKNATLTAPYFFINDGVWQCAGYDSSLQKWRRLPPLTFLPEYCKPDLDLFKEYLVCSKDGIICMNVSKSTEDKLVVFNPLSGKWKKLPPLNHRRNPVLMHLVVDASTQSYQVIVAGSSRSGDERLSRATEVFDSRTGKWKRTGDLPGPDYALNDYQSGVFKDGSLYCIAFLDHEERRGILRYNLNKGIWLKNWTYPIPFSTNSTILHLVQNWEEIYLFSEQENEHRVEHCIDKLEWDIHGNGEASLSLNNVMRAKKMGGRSLEIYPEHTCVPYSKHQLCVFNTIDHSGVVYDVKNHGQSEVNLQAPPAKGFSGECFFSLNPLSFTIEPRFRSKV
ncbi:hypothetical protein KC19_10G020300 [Ceratodon purpureus]|uniref:F-box domain-containing protein n=1 Tax=Ceratodon purpureus TaxID=3225 RepID=A0A8T0GFX8_CERPU|nr:hypothetical protein KC19_10G020300 [Ceratodon purpureus]